MVDYGGVSFSEESSVNEEKLTLKEIMLRHIRKISDICSKEFAHGYWKKKPFKTSDGIVFVEERIEDSREAYSNAVDFLIDLALPQSDNIFKNFVKDNDKDYSGEYNKEERMKTRRKIFKSMNEMFVRLNFFSQSDSQSE